MSHLGTVIKVKAKDEEEAINSVNRLLTDEGEYTSVAGGLIFDYVSEDQTKIAKNEDGSPFNNGDFIHLQDQEKAEYTRYKEQAARERNLEQKGYYLEQAGECLQQNKFWSTQRQAYDLTKHGWDDEDKEGEIFYVETDRHY